MFVKINNPPVFDIFVLCFFKSADGWSYKLINLDNLSKLSTANELITRQDNKYNCIKN